MYIFLVNYARKPIVFWGKIYTAGTNFTRLPVATNLISARLDQILQQILQAFTGDKYEADNDESLTALTFERRAIGLRIGDIRTIFCQKASPKLKFKVGLHRGEE